MSTATPREPVIAQRRVSGGWERSPDNPSTTEDTTVPALRDLLGQAEGSAPSWAPAHTPLGSVAPTSPLTFCQTRFKVNLCSFGVSSFTTPTGFGFKWSAGTLKPLWPWLEGSCCSWAVSSTRSHAPRLSLSSYFRIQTQNCFHTFGHCSTIESFYVLLSPCKGPSQRPWRFRTVTYTDTRVSVWKDKWKWSL